MKNPSDFLLSSPDFMRLLAEVQKNPDDDTAKRVLSDWLEENELQEEADFIRCVTALLECKGSWWLFRSLWPQIDIQLGQTTRWSREPFRRVL